MSTRERWIVYPLLFLTLGSVLRDKLVPQSHFQAVTISADQIRCSRLQSDLIKAIEAAVAEVRCQDLAVQGPNNRPVVVAAADIATGSGLLETYSATGARQVRLAATDVGGAVTTFGRLGNVVVVGHLPEGPGIFTQIPKRGLVPVTPLPGPHAKSGASVPKKSQTPPPKESPKKKGE
jgi:hypothetical protein